MASGAWGTWIRWVFNECCLEMVSSNQLRVVVYPMMYRVLAPSQVVGTGISEPSNPRHQPSYAQMMPCGVQSPPKRAEVTSGSMKPFSDWIPSVRYVKQNPNQKYSIQKIRNWVVVSNIFYFHPYLGKILILTNIFQMGWNHQLGKHEVFVQRLEVMKLPMVSTRSEHFCSWFLGGSWFLGHSQISRDSVYYPESNTPRKSRCTMW